MSKTGTYTTLATLEKAVETLNTLTGSPRRPLRKTAGAILIPQVGNYHLSSRGTKVALLRVATRHPLVVTVAAA